MVALRCDEHLGLMLQPPERLAVNDPVTVSLIGRAERVVLLGPAPTRGVDAARGGNGALAVGNIVGTNLVNLLLILGLSAALVPIALSDRGLGIDALVSPVGVHKGNPQGASYLYVNGRFVRDAVLRKVHAGGDQDRMRLGFPQRKLRGTHLGKPPVRAATRSGTTPGNSIGHSGSHFVSARRSHMTSTIGRMNGLRSEPPTKAPTRRAAAPGPHAP